MRTSLGPLLLALLISLCEADHSIPAGSNSYNVPVSSSYSAVSSNSAPAASFYTVGSSSSISTGSSAPAAASSYSSPSTSYSSSSSSVISSGSSSGYASPSSGAVAAPAAGSGSYSAPSGGSSSSYSAPASGSSSSYSAPASGSSSSNSYAAPASGSSSSSYAAPASGSSSSSYAAPSSGSAVAAAASPSSSYAAAAPSSSSYGAPASTGNLYYYYYPVAAQPITQKPSYHPAKEEDGDISPLLFLLIPLVLLLAAIPLLGLLGLNNNGRSFSGRNSELDAKFGSFDELQSEVDNLLQKYIDALDSEQCMDRVVCELGTRAQNIPSKNLFFSLVEWLAPKHLLLGKERIAIFKKAAKNLDYTLDTCKMFVCNPPKEITHPLEEENEKITSTSTPSPKTTSSKAA